MRVESGNVRRGPLRCRSSSDAIDMMENTVPDLSTSPPTVMMPLIDLLMLNAIVCGLEFCTSAAFCYIPPLLLKAGIRCVIFFVTDVYTVTTKA